jgi:hypothetical protein
MSLGESMTIRRRIAPGEFVPGIFLESAFALLMGVSRDQVCRFTECSDRVRLLSNGLILLIMVLSYPWLLHIWHKHKRLMIALGILAYAAALAEMYRGTVSG